MFQSIDYSEMDSSLFRQLAPKLSANSLVLHYRIQYVLMVPDVYNLLETCGLCENGHVLQLRRISPYSKKDSRFVMLEVGVFEVA